MFPWFRSLALTASLIGLAGCATSEVYSYRNAEFAQTRYDRVSVYVNSYDLGLRKRLEQRMCLAMAPTPCVPVGELVFPGSVSSFGELLDVLHDQGQPNVLVIQIGQDRSSRTVAGTISNTQGHSSASGTWQGQTRGSVDQFGNWQSQTTGSGYASGQSSSTTVTAPIVLYNRNSNGAVELVDTGNRKTAWRGSLVTQGQGIFAITDASFERTQSIHVAQELHQSGLFGPRAR